LRNDHLYPIEMSVVDPGNRRQNTDYGERTRASRFLHGTHSVTEVLERPFDASSRRLRRFIPTVKRNLDHGKARLHQRFGFVLELESIRRHGCEHLPLLRKLDGLGEMRVEKRFAANEVDYRLVRRTFGQHFIDNLEGHISASRQPFVS
jgi:hypothetical protein